jgi:hypothetical protein
MEFGYLQLILAFSGDDLRSVEILGKFHRSYTYGNILTWGGSRIFLLSGGQGA